jgi:citrate lyase subunit beta/citryl-CoA lyase
MSLAGARSLLFVPGSRLDRFAKAEAAGADVVVLDLEDAVGADEKEGARANVTRWLTRGRAVVRINAVGTAEHGADVHAIAGQPGLVGVMLPKAEGREQVASVADLTGVPVVPLVETAVGVRAAHELASAPGTVRLAIGTLDLAADLGCDDTWEAMLLARSQLVLASRSAGVAPPVDGVHVAIGDTDGLGLSTRRARSLGFGARLCLHPDQVDTVHIAFAPTERELARARAVLDMTEAVGILDGQLVDEPVKRWARSVLDRADRHRVWPPAGRHSVTT